MQTPSSGSDPIEEPEVTPPPAEEIATTQELPELEDPTVDDGPPPPPPPIVEDPVIEPEEPVVEPEPEPAAAPTTEPATDPEPPSDPSAETVTPPADPPEPEHPMVPTIVDISDAPAPRKGKGYRLALPAGVWEVVFKIIALRQNGDNRSQCAEEVRYAGDHYHVGLNVAGDTILVDITPDAVARNAAEQSITRNRDRITERRVSVDPLAFKEGDSKAVERAEERASASNQDSRSRMMSAEMVLKSMHPPFTLELPLEDMLSPGYTMRKEDQCWYTPSSP